MNARFRLSLGSLSCALFVGLALAGCGDSKATGGGGDGGSAATSGDVNPSGTTTNGVTSTGDTTAATGGGTCATDPLKTGLTAMQTGVAIDSFDCQIITDTAKYNEPDAMIFKAMMYVESRFDDTSVACPNDPCGVPSGWTTAESGCYGLLQIVPACMDSPNGEGLLPNGQPNLETDPTAGDWAGSIFNPDINTDAGIAGVAGNRTQVKAQFPGCTEEQYTLMAVGNFNSYGSAKSCTEYNTDYDGPVLMAYQQYAAAAGYTPHPYPQ